MASAPTILDTLAVFVAGRARMVTRVVAVDFAGRVARVQIAVDDGLVVELPGREVRLGGGLGRLAFVIIKVTLLINHYNENKLANYFENFNSACRFLMVAYYRFHVLCICYNS